MFILSFFSFDFSANASTCSSISTNHDISLHFIEPFNDTGVLYKLNLSNLDLNDFLTFVWEVKVEVAVMLEETGREIKTRHSRSVYVSIFLSVQGSWAG